MSDPASLTSHHKVGWGDLLTGKNAIRSLALAGGVALHAVNVYIATTILPSVVADIGGLDYYAWNTTLFVVASIIGSTLAVKLLRAVGPRKAYAISACVFAFGHIDLCIVTKHGNAVDWPVHTGLWRRFHAGLVLCDDPHRLS